MIDWITISQKHRLEMVDGVPQPLPVLNGGYVISLTRDENGELIEEYNTNKRFKHEGSHDSSVQIMCDGQTVTVSGNIGKLGREDNVFNLSIDETIDKLNALVTTQYKLPPFSFEEPTYFYPERTQKLEMAEHFGAVITMLHVCRNFKTGEGQAVKMLDLLATKSVGHVKNGRTPDGHTVYWGRKGGRRYTKAYIKHIEMLVHAKKKGKVYAEAFAQSEIYKYCEKNGIVRIEIELDRKTLIDKGLRFGQGLTMTALRQIYDERVNEIVQLDNVTATEHDISHLPKKLHLIASAYFQGIALSKTLERSTFYRHAKNLRAYGIDITIPYKGEKTFNPIIKHISLINAVQPSWYELKGSVDYVQRQHLRVV